LPGEGHPDGVEVPLRKTFARVCQTANPQARPDPRQRWCQRWCAAVAGASPWSLLYCAIDVAGFPLGATRRVAESVRTTADGWLCPGIVSGWRIERGC